MKKMYWILFVFSLGMGTFFTSCNKSAVQKDVYLADYVNPLIGTRGAHKTLYGGCVPAVITPFGMTQWVPMTRENRIGVCPYYFDDEKIIGFMASHQPAVWMGDYGFMSFMPQVDQAEITADRRGMDYSHQDEVARPYYYSVRFSKEGREILSEHTATPHCGFFQITYPEDGDAWMTIEMSREAGYSGYIKILPEERMVIGYNSDRHNRIYGKNMGPELKKFKSFFVIQFDSDIEEYGTYSICGKNDSSAVVQKDMGSVEESGEQIGGMIRLKKGRGGRVKVRIASSFISYEQASANLEKELVSWNFDKMKRRSRDEWERRLERIEIEAPDSQKRLFYTFMYNSFKYPCLFSEHGRYYSPFDEKIHDGTSYNSFSLWDTFRALHPLLLFIAPDHVGPMITALIQMYQEGGWIPKWPNPTYTNIMIGTHSDAVIADACVKGIKGVDWEKAYEAIYKNAMTPPDGDTLSIWADRGNWKAYEARGGLTWYKKLGYVPCDKAREASSRTIEFAYGDYCVAQVAKKIGKQQDYEFFMKRSRNYRNVYNPESGFMHARRSDGKFAEKINENAAFTEASPMTCTLFVPHDIAGMIEMLGGKEAFVAKLDENFKRFYRHQNEPGHHNIYLYDYVGRHDKTQKLVSRILSTKYHDGPDGLPGNDDCGQMSAWYVFSALGFYPVTPGSVEYAIGVPLYRSATLHLEGGKTFTVQAENLSEQNNTVRGMRLNGKKLEKPFITHQDIMNGGTLEFEMGPDEN